MDNSLLLSHGKEMKEYKPNRFCRDLSRTVEKVFLTVLLLTVLHQQLFAGWRKEGTEFVLFDGISRKISCNYFMSGDSVLREIRVWMECKDVLTDSLLQVIHYLDWVRQADSKYIKSELDIPVSGYFLNGIVACFTPNKAIAVFNIDTNKTIWQLQSTASLNGIFISGNYLYTTTAHGSLMSYELSTGNPAMQYPGLCTSIERVQTERSGRWIALTGKNNATYIFDLQRMVCVDSIFNAGPVTMSDSDGLFYIKGRDRIVRYDFKSHRIEQVLPLHLQPDESIRRTEFFDLRYLAVELYGQAPRIEIINLLSQERAGSFYLKSIQDNYSHHQMLGISSGYLITVNEKKDITALTSLPRDSQPPVLTLSVPEQGSGIFSTTEEFLFIKGRALDSSLIKGVYLNNELVPFIGTTGDFSGFVKLDYGENLLLIRANDKYNNNTEISLKVKREKSQQRGAVVAVSGKAEDQLKAYTYHAILIAEQQYADQYIGNLAFPVLDAQNFSKILVGKYGFEEKNVLVASNYTRIQIIKCFDSLLSVLTDKDHLLIFYAGHGVFDPKLKQGYWLPVDATLDNKANWISNNDIRDYISAFETRHTLLISDACFSGSIFEFNREVRYETVISRLLGKKSRTAMTSGFDNPVPDRSVFLRYLLAALMNNSRTYLRASEVFADIQESVLTNTENIPQYGPLKLTNHEGGDFIFLRKN